jgi:hypothetical protein
MNFKMFLSINISIIIAYLYSFIKYTFIKLLVKIKELLFYNYLVVILSHKYSSYMDYILFSFSIFLCYEEKIDQEFKNEMQNCNNFSDL